MSAVEKAAELAAAGVPVFPCRADKRPTCPHGLLDASDQVEAVRELWRRYPGPLIGVPTGPGSGLDVLDIDPRHGGDRWWVANLHRMPQTRMHRTRSGGLHALFRADARVRNSASKIGPGIDVRATGGYIVHWPSEGCEITEAPLAPWPLWLLRRALKRPASRRPATAGPPFAALNPSDAAQRIAERVLSQLEQAQAGQRHYTLRKAAFTIGGLIERLPFGEAEAAERLVRAVERAGGSDLVNARKTAAWGLACGTAAPLKLGIR